MQRSRSTKGAARPRSVADARIEAFETILVLVSVAEFWTMAIDGRPWADPVRVATLASATLCGIATRFAPYRTVAFAGLALSLALLNGLQFPATGNHRYLEMVLCALCALLDPKREDEHQLLVRSVRWITCVVMFYAGIQKLVHGYYTSGVMPAFLLQEPRFGPIFGLFLSAEEAKRILSYDGMDGAGPYLVSSPLFLVVSNFVWIFEVVLAIALAVPRTRVFAVVAGFLFLLAIEAAAREVFFGLLYVNLMLLFLANDLNRRCVPVFAALCALMILMRIGWLPEVELH